jgi:hypothetical protein
VRLNLGRNLTVSANVDQWLTYLKAGQSFAGGTAIGPVAGQLSHVQLFNPAASGKTLYVRNLFFDISATMSVHLNIDNTQRATDVGTGINLLSGGAASVAHIRRETNAAEQGTVFNQWSPLANTVIKPYSDWIIILAAGQGLTLVGLTVNTTLEAAFQWAEV